MYKWSRSRRSLLLLLVVLLPSWLLFGYYTASVSMAGGPAPRASQQQPPAAPAPCRSTALARADIDTIAQFSIFDFQEPQTDMGDPTSEWTTNSLTNYYPTYL